MAHELSASTLEQFVTFGDFLRFLRRRASLTQMELATAVGYSESRFRQRSGRPSTLQGYGVIHLRAGLPCSPSS